MTKNVFINTLGCAKNEVDSRNMSKKLVAAGFGVTNDFDECDLAIINTCSFIEAATQESIDTILEFAGLDRKVPIVVSGCMPVRYAGELEEQLPEVSAFMPVANENNVVEVVTSLIGSPDGEGSDVVSRQISAYVKISDGCDRRCAFCTIPLIRGKYESYSEDSICDEVAELVKNGTVEVNLVAQDTGHWGRDFDEKSSLANLLTTLANKFPKTYFRILYVQPDEVTDELLYAIRDNENVVNYLDIPLQHVSAKILKDMNRTGDVGDFEARIEHIKEIIPDVTLRTTLMVGFPGESDEEFEELLDYASQGTFDYIGVFAYSNEDMSKSFEYPDQIDEEEKQYRLQEVVDVINAVSAAKLHDKIGKTFKVIIEDEESDGQLVGRALFQAPEVDGVVYVDKGEIGQVVDVKMTDSFIYDLEGEVQD